VLKKGQGTLLMGEVGLSREVIHGRLDGEEVVRGRAGKHTSRYEKGGE